jgi:hypothetical protein
MGMVLLYWRVTPSKGSPPAKREEIFSAGGRCMLSKNQNVPRRGYSPVLNFRFAEAAAEREGADYELHAWDCG